MTFEEFVAGYGRSLVRLAYVLSGDHQLAEDLTQTVLADAYRHWRKVRVARSPEAYVRRMLVNAHLSWQRRRSATERPTDLRAATGAAVDDPGEVIAARDQMRVLLAGLAPRARTVLVLRFYADLDDAAIAEAMGVNESSVRATASRALASLRGPATVDAREESR
ncbi:SigE family RNA polymerase sigma factor [Winogradskya humida]|uniref:DNA-directed RNA polymerase sigma-70 factor n=1 Tax=Winogradskya humida TaxID=113566 RepID=A0ABQ3ZJJ3_9ACTN|nr:SigE family RNA polymerase sigma factor [Actinoplanes humidus]GIE18672.1 DNA-directed RNA polymerase sigma-70 factor [Actinoplanes humidus]